jgi:hypothetical protein
MIMAYLSLSGARIIKVLATEADTAMHKIMHLNVLLCSKFQWTDR